MFVKIENNAPVEWPVQGFQIRSAFKNISFPSPIELSHVVDLGFEAYKTADKPEFDELVQTVEERPPVKQDDVWVQQWAVVELYDEAEREQVLAQAEADKLEAQKESVRSERNAKLSSTDWTQVADAPVDQTAWATYRQALRDVPQQAGFPWDVQWPDEPN
jgi:hypothetical protein